MKSSNSGLILVVSALFTVFNLNAQPSFQDSALKIVDSLRKTDYHLTNAAVTYHEQLVSPLQEYRIAGYDYIKAVTRIRKARKIEKTRQELLKVLENQKERLKRCSPFQDDDTLRYELIRYLDLDYIVLKEDFDKILDMEDINAQSYDQTEAHQLAIDMAVEKLDSSFNILIKAEKNFFKKYGIKTKDVKDELSVKIEKANKTMKYYDTVYRIFFKVYKQNAYAMTALNNKDIAGLEQHASTLVSFTEEGLEKLRRNEGYEGDKDLVNNAVEMLEFYLHEGKDIYPANVDFYIKADNLQKANKKFNSIKEGDRKQEDVDQYNSAVNIYNKAVKEINKTNSVSIKKHNELINAWNKAVDEFLKKHS
jgi:hypothetical protein